MVNLKLTSDSDSAGRPIFELEHPYAYLLGPGCSIVVPAGYRTNFGTIPRWFAWWISPGQLREAAIVHDFMCNEDFTDDGKEIQSGYSRWLADAVLYEAMGKLGFSWIKRVTVWMAVRSSAWARGLNRERR